VHEAVHQLTCEVARAELRKWVDEGTAEYFSTSRLTSDGLELGATDRNTYPIWWVPDMQLTGDLERDLKDLSVIPLRAIITGRDGPDLDKHFNLYYIHWWSLTHFLFHYEEGKYRQAYLQVIREGGAPESFEKHIGPVESVQKEWYEYLLAQWRALGGGLAVRRADQRTERNKTQ